MGAAVTPSFHHFPENQGNSDIGFLYTVQKRYKTHDRAGEWGSFRVVGLIFFQAKYLRRAAFGRNAVGAV